MIFEYFRATRSYESIQRLSDFSLESLQNGAVQDFDVRWDHALLFVSELP